MTILFSVICINSEKMSSWSRHIKRFSCYIIEVSIKLNSKNEMIWKDLY